MVYRKLFLSDPDELCYFRVFAANTPTHFMQGFTACFQDNGRIIRPLLPYNIAEIFRTRCMPPIKTAADFEKYCLVKTSSRNKFALANCYQLGRRKDSPFAREKILEVARGLITTTVNSLSQHRKDALVKLAFLKKNVFNKVVESFKSEHCLKLDDFVRLSTEFTNLFNVDSLGFLQDVLDDFRTQNI